MLSLNDLSRYYIMHARMVRQGRVCFKQSVCGTNAESNSFFALLFDDVDGRFYMMHGQFDEDLRKGNVDIDPHEPPLASSDVEHRLFTTCKYMSDQGYEPLGGLSMRRWPVL